MVQAGWLAGRPARCPLRVRAALAALLVGVFSLGPVREAEAQRPLLVGASISRTGAYAELAPALQHGYRLCVKHANEKGGVMGRPLQLVIEDDRSEPATAARLYERFITQDRVDALLGPYSSPITEAVADVAEKHRMPLVASGAAATSIFKKGRRYVFMLVSPAEVYLEGLVDMAARRGLRTLALIHEDTLFPRAIAEGTVALARTRGLSVVAVEAYPRGTKDFSGPLMRIRDANPDVLGAGTYFDDAVAITRQLERVDLNPKMFAATVGSDFPKFYTELGRTAEFVYGNSQWEPDLVALLRAGGRIPVTRRYPGAREFVEAHRREFPGVAISYHTAQGYGGCQVFVEAVRRADSLDGPKVRDALLKMDLNTVFGPFKVDADGVQIAHKMLMFQWQDGKKVIVWPDELAPDKPRFPTPPWSQRP
ncbi:MAG: amino acid ABC transporter substrate-binding protein [Candidatus Rokubacteria bacterium]|nr:amino acid ABC transporter substrate-binding protein [Candidatus Rokubacteria bacterium]